MQPNAFKNNIQNPCHGLQNPNDFAPAYLIPPLTICTSCSLYSSPTVPPLSSHELFPASGSLHLLLLPLWWISWLDLYSASSFPALRAQLKCTYPHKLLIPSRIFLFTVNLPPCLNVSSLRTGACLSCSTKPTVSSSAYCVLSAQSTLFTFLVKWMHGPNVKYAFK